MLVQLHLNVTMPVTKWAHYHSHTWAHMLPKACQHKQP